MATGTGALIGGTTPSYGYPTGSVVQVVNYQTGAVSTDTGTAMTFNDDIPQITEGKEYMTLAITPKSATNKLKIDVIVYYAPYNSGDDWCVALFQDATAGALAAQSNQTYSAYNDGGSASLTYFMTAGTTSATTFRVRCGAGVSSGTNTFNGIASGRIYGGVMMSSITITEIAG
jgi:hypothetical protein